MEESWNEGLKHWKAQRARWTRSDGEKVQASQGRLDQMRAKLNARDFLTIHTALVVQGKKPKRPLNLALVVKSLICGWKEDGTWPQNSQSAPDGRG